MSGERTVDLPRTPWRPTAWSQRYLLAELLGTAVAVLVAWQVGLRTDGAAAAA